MSKNDTGSFKECLDKSVIHLQKGKAKKAVKELLRGMKAEPWNTDFAFQVAAIYQRLNDNKSVLKTFRDNIKFLEKAKNLVEEKDFLVSKVQLFKAILSIEPDNADIRYEVASLYLKQENLNASFMEAFIAYEHLKEQNNPKKASEMRKFIKSNPLPDFEKNLLISEYYYRVHNEDSYYKVVNELQKRYKSDQGKLKKIYEKHLNFHPQDEMVIRKYTSLLIKEKSYREANSLLRKALSYEPDNLYFKELKAITAVRLNLLEEALDNFLELKKNYQELNEKTKLELVGQNIEEIKKSMEEAENPPEMPKEFSALTNLETVIENTLDVKNTTTFTFKEERSQNTNLDEFEDMREELVKLFEGQLKDPDVNESVEDLKTLFIDFSKQIEQIVAGDFEACLDVAIAYHVMEQYDLAMNFYKLAIECDSPRKVEALKYMQKCKKAYKKAA